VTSDFWGSAFTQRPVISWRAKEVGDSPYQFESGDAEIVAEVCHQMTGPAWYSGC